MPAQDHAPLDEAAFDALMAGFGPWPDTRSASGPGQGPVAVAVSGGADSVCLAILAAGWAARCGLAVLALVVDHRLRPDSAEEARQTVARLAEHGIKAQLLVLDGLLPGPGLAERARHARYDALRRACREHGAVDLLLGHHRSDQAETVLMRRRAASGPDGLAGMAPLLELDDVRLLRPLLFIAPGRLRASLTERGIGWIEDPSNRDRRAERTRARDSLSRDPALGSALVEHAVAAGQARQQRRAEEAALLAAEARLYPQGFALLPPGLVPAGALAALIRSVGGQPHRAAPAAIERLLRVPRAATLAGVRIMPAGRMGPGWLLVREAASLAPPVAAAHGARWDQRFVLCGAVPQGRGMLVAALGGDAAILRRRDRLPAAVLRTLPTLRDAAGGLLAVPHLGWTATPGLDQLRFRFQPSSPASESTPFTPPPFTPGAEICAMLA